MANLNDVDWDQVFDLFYDRYKLEMRATYNCDVGNSEDMLEGERDSMTIALRKVVDAIVNNEY